MKLIISAAKKQSKLHFLCNKNARIFHSETVPNAQKRGSVFAAPLCVVLYSLFRLVRANAEDLIGDRLCVVLQIDLAVSVHVCKQIQML